MFLKKISKIWFVNYGSETWFLTYERLYGGMLAIFWQYISHHNYVVFFHMHDNIKQTHYIKWGAKI